MSDQIDPNTAVVVPVRNNNASLFLSLFAMLLVIGGLAGGYFYLHLLTSTLAQQVNDVRQQNTKNADTLMPLQQSVTQLQQAAEHSQSLSERQEQLMAEWQAAQKGNLDKWYVAEAQYLVKLANEQLQYAQNVASAVTLLQRADQLLQNRQDERLSELRKSIANDLNMLNASPQIDVTRLYLMLVTLNQQLDQLPLPAMPLKQTVSPVTPSTDETQSWWQTGLNHTWQALKKLVVIHYDGANALPLVLPEEKPYLYHNLHAQMDNAMWAVLHRNANIYQASLAQVMQWVQQYFVKEAPITQSTLQQLDELRKMNIQTPNVNLSGTLQQFDQYLGQPTAPAPVS